MSDERSNQTLMALLALTADDFVTSDNVASPSAADEAPRLPSLDQRTDMFLRAVYGPDQPITAEMRSAARDRLIGEMAADLLNGTVGPAPVPVDATPVRVGIDSRAAQPVAPVRASTSQLWASPLRWWQELLRHSESFTVRGLGMAAVPLVALLVVGSIWTTSWINQGTDSTGDQNRGPGSGANETLPISRSLNAQPDNVQTEQNLRRDIAATEATFGPAHPAVARKLVDLAALLYAKKQYAEAEELCTRALTIEQRALGPNDPETVRTIKELAMIYRAQGRSQEADDLLARVGQP